MYIRYIARINDLTFCSHLLRAGLELRLMGDRPEDISKALAALGPETWNPYTGRPFNWDEERKTVWGESSTPPTRMEVKI